MSQSSYFWIWGVERSSGRHVQLQCPAATARQAVARGEAEGLNVTGLAMRRFDQATPPPHPAAEAPLPTDGPGVGGEPIAVSAGGRRAAQSTTTGRQAAGRPPSAGRGKTSAWRFQRGLPKGFRISATSWIIVLVPVFTDLIMRATNPPPPPATILAEADGVYLITFAVALAASYIAWQVGRESSRPRMSGSASASGFSRSLSSPEQRSGAGDRPTPPW
ncbi:MAG: hypothetical protein WD009_14105 [Phycisphaeraceae bacterium]